MYSLVFHCHINSIKIYEKQRIIDSSHNNTSNNCINQSKQIIVNRLKNSLYLSVQC